MMAGYRGYSAEWLWSCISSEVSGPKYKFLKFECPPPCYYIRNISYTQVSIVLNRTKITTLTITLKSNRTRISHLANEYKYLQ